jgi:hypothetical protein
MARPRKNPDDPKWLQNVGTSEQIPSVEVVNDYEWKMYFAAALTGLIARGGFSSEQMIKTAKQYADEARKAANGDN